MFVSSCFFCFTSFWRRSLAKRIKCVIVQLFLLAPVFRLLPLACDFSEFNCATLCMHVGVFTVLFFALYYSSLLLGVLAL